MTNRAIFSLGVVAVAALWCVSATAAPVVYFGENQTPALTVTGAPKMARDAFVGALTGVGTETFETRGVGATAPVLAFPGSSGGINATISGSGVVDSGSLDGRFNTTGAEAAPVDGNYWRSDGNWSITFDSAIAAFGFYATDIGDFNGNIQLTLTDVNNVMSMLVINNTVSGENGSLLFWGFIDSGNTYKSIAFGNTQPGVDLFGVDDMIVGVRGQIQPPTGVPTPGTLALVAIGLLGLGAVVRRRRS